jgi:hypothetical protein
MDFWFEQLHRFATQLLTAFLLDEGQIEQSAGSMSIRNTCTSGILQSLRRSGWLSLIEQQAHDACRKRSWHTDQDDKADRHVDDAEQSKDPPRGIQEAGVDQRASRHQT